nr:VC0807 family protein [Acidocella sp.]
MIANFLAPYLVYQALHGAYGETEALIASALPPLLWSLYELAKTRRLDAISLVVVASIAFTLAATALGGSPRLIQIREALVTGAVGLIFLVSLSLEKPLVFYLARAASARHTARGAAQFETIWNRRAVRRTFKVLTAVWGSGLVLQTLLLCGLAWVWPIGRYLLFAPVIAYGLFGLLLLWSLWYGGKSHALAALCWPGAVGPGPMP